MDATLAQTIRTVLAAHRTMTLATLRPDGWPQATTVGYASEGFVLYFLCGPDSQKATNLARDNRVSLTIDHDTADVMEIVGLSMAAHAHRVTAPAEAQRIMDLLVARYGHQPSFTGTLPKASEMAIFRLEPVVISVIDYTKGFAHTDLVTC